MAYNITQTNGAELISGGLADGTIDTTTTSLTLVGKNYPGYGTFLNQNVVRIVENFANGSSPTGPLPGQLWWDTSTKLMKINTATAKGAASQVFKPLATMSSSASAPNSPVTGEQWWDTSNLQLKVYNGTSWTTVGPVATSSTGNTGAIPDTIVSVSPSATYVVVKMYVDNTLVAIWSKESDFTTTVSGFATIKPGLNLSTAIANNAFQGNASSTLGIFRTGDSSATSVDNIILNGGVGAQTINGAVSLTNDSGLTVGAGSDGQILVTSDQLHVKGLTNNKDVIFSLNKGSVDTNFFKGNATSGLAEVYANPTASSSGFSVATKDYVDTRLGGGVGTTTFTANVNPAANVTYTLGNVTNRWSNVISQTSFTGNLFSANVDTTRANVSDLFIATSVFPTVGNTINLGSNGMRFNTIYGVSLQAQYADLAERFASDSAYPAGTVVALGGAEEITAASDALSDDVFGVISTKAAYLMNSSAGSDETHPAVAVNGRVPVRVIGPVKKGQRLVAAGNGLARAGSRSEVTAFNVIGRSLQNKLDDGEGVVEAIVKLNS
jgi:hypothetical protein